LIFGYINSRANEVTLLFLFDAFRNGHVFDAVISDWLCVVLFMLLGLYNCKGGSASGLVLVGIVYGLMFFAENSGH
jgi:hypothetical protein